ncbi:DMBT1 [Branchiostoma lanceolatum]|uniref:Soluble scavenger receptor cysteine-rich domain-containing protein SSC5D n=1 Tax=Branchiostoma lanceolatum TaxID=7740 RepID=A0A8J9Z6Q9_BRALA|nr:DMBT1 [Branchiostoma lanceolatum]
MVAANASCEDGHSVRLTCLTRFLFRLSGGQKPNEGRVEFRRGRNGWGTVCNKGWDIHNADVLCRYVGYKGAVPISVNFGPGSGRIWLRDVRCTGNESTILRCPYRERRQYCDHDDDVGVVCDGGECNSNPCQNNGTCIEGVDHYICQCGREWVGVNCETRNQTVLTKQWERFKPSDKFRFHSGILTVLEEGDYYIYSQVYHWYNNKTSPATTHSVMVVKTDKDNPYRFLTCWKNVKETDPWNTCYTAGVIHLFSNNSVYLHMRCDGIVCIHLARRLAYVEGQLAKQGASASEETSTEERFGPHTELQMYDGTNVHSATVFGKKIKEHRPYNGPALPSSPREHQNRKRRSDTKTSETIEDVRLIHQEHFGFTLYVHRIEGDLTVKVGGRWFHVCHKTFGRQEADVACRHLYKDRSDRSFLFRLSGGQKPNEGRVEFRRGRNGWGTVCNKGWDIQDADVLCRYLGYKGTVPISINYGPGSGRIWLRDVRCTGNESTILRCPYRERRHSCDHGDDVGVVCDGLCDSNPCQNKGICIDGLDHYICQCGRGWVGVHCEISCNKEQEQNMERVQKRALRIISLGGRREVPTLPMLKERREAAAVKLLRNMLEENHPLHDMVPPARALASGRTLRNGTAITVPVARTQRLKNSFLHQAIRLYNKATQ